MSENKELSEREREILRLVATGASNKEISQQLFISANTTKVHLRNIFAKIGVSSRTEATLFAIREGLVQMDRAIASVVDAPAAEIAVPQAQPRRLWQIALVGGLAIVLVVVLNLAVSLRQPTPIASASPAPPVSNRWKSRTALLTPRSNFAATSYENKIYAIGGESDGKVIASVERYDPDADAWESLAYKPTAVADMSAALVRGRIYVPGGRLASGRVTDVMEMYDPRTNQWEARAALPIALSAYALAAFEGKIYLFGGWTGERYVATAYEYDPEADAWRARTAMQTARGFAGTAIAGGKTLVIGGYDGKQALAVNEQYSPNLDDGAQNPWAPRQPLPSPRYAMGVASVADFVYVIGGQGAANTSLPALQYLPDRWQELESPGLMIGSHLGLVPVQTFLYAMGGKLGQAATAQNLAYQAIFTIILPIGP